MKIEKEKININEVFKKYAKKRGCKVTVVNTKCLSDGAYGADNNIALVKEIEILNQEFDELPNEEKIRFLKELENKE